MGKEWLHEYEEGAAGGSGGRERWMVTYADLITLLLVFFIVMYASSSRISGEKFDALASSLATSIKKTVKPKVSDKHAFSPDDSRQTRKFKATADAVIQSIVKTDPKSNVKIDIDERGMVVSLIDTSFFDSGSATLKPSGQKVLNKVAANFKGLPNEIRIEGHTDSIPIRGGGRFASNWELSSARATAVARYLIDKVRLPAHRMSVAAFAANRPVASNGMAEGRKRNRRVDIVILKQEEASPIGAGVPIQLTPAAAPSKPKGRVQPSAAPKRGFANPFQ
ncbi:MAG: flagellar motor protein MotB [Candidatus Sericytochromatia bacterium]|nr:flagellar motor protein MotB [Candidatus Sericytochromatia bacterium]